jgi:hypothetical protein
VPRQGVFDPPPDFLDGGRGLCEKRLKVHVGPLVSMAPGDGGGRSGRIIVGADLVNASLTVGFCKRMRATRMAATDTTIAAAKPSVRAGVLAATLVALVTLSIATFELSMADFPSGLVIMAIVPLAALLFFACLLWSASQLPRIRQDGVKFAVPFLICAGTLAALQYAPLQTIYLKHNFWTHRADRGRIVERVENGELFPNVGHNKNLIALGADAPYVSAGGNDIVIDDTDDGVYVLFLTSRGLKHYFTGFLRVPPGGDPKKFFEFEDKPPTRLVRYDENWWFVAN